MEPLASLLCKPVRRTGGGAPRKEIRINRRRLPYQCSLRCLAVIETTLEFEAEVSPQTAKLELILCFTDARVKDNRDFLSLAKRNSKAFLLAVVRRLCSKTPPLLVCLLFAITAESQNADNITHDKNGTRLTAFHEGFQKQPAHLYQFDHERNGYASVRGAWKSISEHQGDQLSEAENSYIMCIKEQMQCIGASVKQEGS
jgi:hypothetical protein